MDRTLLSLLPLDLMSQWTLSPAGVPFIQATRMIIDTADQVAECRALDADPFPIEYRRASCHVPRIEASSMPLNRAHFTNVIQEVEHLESFIADACAAKASSVPAPVPGTRQVHFGTRPAQTYVSGLAGNGMIQSSASRPEGGTVDSNGDGRSLPTLLMNDSIQEYHDPSMGDTLADTPV